MARDSQSSEATDMDNWMSCCVDAGISTRLYIIYIVSGQETGTPRPEKGKQIHDFQVQNEG